MDYWEDLATLDRTVVFDRAIIVSRETSDRQYVSLPCGFTSLFDDPTASPLSRKWFKMISPTMSIKAAPDFFEPIRRAAITNLLGHFPILNARGAVVGITTSHDKNDILSHDIQSDLPIVTYISRQGGARRLSDADHEGLVQTLRGLEGEGVCKVNIVRMETMTVKEQVAVVARSTVRFLTLL